MPSPAMILRVEFELYSSQSHKEQASQIDVLEMKTKQVNEVLYHIRIRVNIISDTF